MLQKSRRSPSLWSLVEGVTRTVASTTSSPLNLLCRADILLAANVLFPFLGDPFEAGACVGYSRCPCVLLLRLCRRRESRLSRVLSCERSRSLVREQNYQISYAGLKTVARLDEEGLYSHSTQQPKVRRLQSVETNQPAVWLSSLRNLLA